MTRMARALLDAGPRVAESLLMQSCSPQVSDGLMTGTGLTESKGGRRDRADGGLAIEGPYAWVSWAGLGVVKGDSRPCHSF